MTVEIVGGVQVSFPQDCGNARGRWYWWGFTKHLPPVILSIFRLTQLKMRWDIVGKQVLENQAASLELLEQYRAAEGGLKEIVILNAITHGNTCGSTEKSCAAVGPALAFAMCSFSAAYKNGQS